MSTIRASIRTAQKYISSHLPIKINLLELVSVNYLHFVLNQGVFFQSLMQVTKEILQSFTNQLVNLVFPLLRVHHDLEKIFAKDFVILIVL